MENKDTADDMNVTIQERKTSMFVEHYLLEETFCGCQLTDSSESIMWHSSDMKTFNSGTMK